MGEVHSHKPIRVRIISCFVEVLLWMSAYTIRQINGDIPHWVESPRKYGRYSWQIEGQLSKWHCCRKEVSKNVHKLWYRCIPLLKQNFNPQDAYRYLSLSIDCKALIPFGSKFQTFRFSVLGKS